MEEALHRGRLLFGDDAIEALAHSRVVVFGTGGVGSWCAEALVRGGVGHLTMVDADAVDVTNINRQLPATSLTVGKPKVDVLCCRLREIRPCADIRGIAAFYADGSLCYPDGSSEPVDLAGYDVVIDAIDSLASKSALILQACATPGVRLFSSMGAAQRRDPALVAVSEFWKVQGCPLARALRSRFKKSGCFPARKFRCVYSPEQPSGQPKGTCMAVTATFGLRLAALAIDAITLPGKV